MVGVQSKIWHIYIIEAHQITLGCSPYYGCTVKFESCLINWIDLATTPSIFNVKSRGLAHCFS